MNLSAAAGQPNVSVAEGPDMDSLSVAPREKALTFARCLRAGDLVQMRADRLGSMSNAIIADRLTPDVPPSTISQ